LKDRCNDGLPGDEDDDDDGFVNPHVQIPTIRPESSSDCENLHGLKN